MLILSRRLQEKIKIGADIEIVIVAFKGNQVKIGIQAPDDVRILRQELEEKYKDTPYVRKEKPEPKPKEVTTVIQKRRRVVILEAMRMLEI